MTGEAPADLRYRHRPVHGFVYILGRGQGPPQGPPLGEVQIAQRAEIRDSCLVKAPILLLEEIRLRDISCTEGPKQACRPGAVAVGYGVYALLGRRFDFIAVFSENEIQPGMVVQDTGGIGGLSSTSHRSCLLRRDLRRMARCAGCRAGILAAFRTVLCGPGAWIGEVVGSGKLGLQEQGVEASEGENSEARLHPSWFTANGHD